MPFCKERYKCSKTTTTASYTNENNKDLRSIISPLDRLFEDKTADGVEGKNEGEKDGDGDFAWADMQI